ncbi:MAG: IS3 family transposase [Prochloraceae cyanobacterium]
MVFRKFFDINFEYTDNFLILLHEALELDESTIFRTEMVYFRKFRHLVEAIACTIDYIRFYNSKRLHLGLWYETPDEVAALAE